MPPTLPYYPALPSTRLMARRCYLQVGLIASLKNEHKHDIVEKVGPGRNGWQRRRGAQKARPSPALLRRVWPACS